MSAGTMQAHPVSDHEAVAVHPGGSGMPTALVGMLLFLLSDEASWITGQIFNVDGGQIIRS